MTTRRRTDRSVAVALRPSWSDASGKAPIRGLIALLLTAGLVYGGVKLIPVRADAFAFDDAVKDEVVFAGGRRLSDRRSSDEQIKKNLVERAQALGLPVTVADIQIRRPGRKYIIVEVDYTIRVEFIGGFTYDWSFAPRHEGPLIF